MKEQVLIILGAVGGFLSFLLGGWDTGLQTLLIVMAVDIITGIMLSFVFHQSPKTENGALESKTMWKGMCRKGVTLAIVLVAHQLDVIMGTAYIRDAVVFAFVANEIVSVIENAGLMGVPVPQVVVDGIELLKKKQDNKVID